MEKINENSTTQMFQGKTSNLNSQQNKSAVLLCAFCESLSYVNMEIVASCYALFGKLLNLTLRSCMY